MARNIYVDPRDLDALSRVAFAEAKTINDPRKYTSVVDSINNRVATGGWFGGDIESVVNKPKQYTPVNKFGTWEGLGKAPLGVETQIARHLSERAFGAPSTVGEATHYLNPSVAHTAPAKQSWAKDFANWAQVGLGNIAHRFGAPDAMGAIPEHNISLSPQIQDQLSGVYGPAEMMGGNVFGSIAAPGAAPEFSFNPTQPTNPVQTTPISGFNAGLMDTSLAGLGPTAGSFDPGYRNPDFETVDVRPSDMPLSTPFGAPVAGATPAPSSPQAAPDLSPAAMGAVGDVIGQMSQAHPTYGLQGMAEQMTAMGMNMAPPGTFGPPPSATPAVTAAAPVTAPTVRSVQTMSMPGLSPEQIGEAPVADPRARINAAFDSFPAASPMSVAEMTAAMQAKQAAPPTAVAAAAPTVSNPAQPGFSLFGATPAMAAPAPLSNMAAITGAPAPVSSAFTPGAAVPSFGAIAGPQATVQAPSQTPAVQAAQTPVSAPAVPMARPAGLFGAPPAMAAPTPSVTVASPQAQDQQQAQAQQGQSSVAPPVSPTAGMVSAGDFARAMAAQKAARNAAMDSAGPEAAKGAFGSLWDALSRAFGGGGNHSTTPSSGGGGGAGRSSGSSRSGGGTSSRSSKGTANTTGTGGKARGRNKAR